LLLKRKPWWLNRIFVGLLVFFFVVGLWTFKWKPQYRPYYENGVRFYQNGEYMNALVEMDRAYQIAPNSTDVIMMEGWINLKLKRYEEARMYFGRVLRIDPRIEEAQMGAAFVALDTGRGQVDYLTLAKYLGKRTADPNIAILIAHALAQEGKNRDAAEIYLKLERDKNYGKAANIALKEILGLEGSNDLPTVGFADTPKPAQTQVLYRADSDGMYELTASGWQKYYVNGVDLGPAAPGYYPNLPPNDFSLYRDWIKKAEEIKGNTLRVYTLLPPAFYRAFARHKESGGKIQLYQQIWIGDPPNRDLYDPKFYETTKAEIRYAIDAIHGHGDVPKSRARGSGLYSQDVSRYVSGILFGREIEPSVAQQTNIVNGGKGAYAGRYISISGANATEVWFAEMLDYLIGYEQENYNWQHPVAIVNWPPLDPLTHPTETPNLDEVKFRIRHGERLEIPKGIEDDNDVVAIDEAKYHTTPAFFAGMFASYHIYPYYPDFLLFDQGYLNARDAQGTNPMYGYVKELRARVQHPLVVTEFGIPNSVGISHFHPYGWHHGGHSEEQQAEIESRLAESIQQAGAAGGIAFALIDEWYKHNWLIRDFENPEDRSALWLNELDPEKRYGMVGFRSSKWKLFSDPTAWAGADTVYEGKAGGVRRVQAAIDEAFLYLRLEGACTDCEPKRSYAIALNTLPSNAGIRTLPIGGGVRAFQGANFVLYLKDAESSRLLIADNYNPYQLVPRVGVPGETELTYKRNFTSQLQETGTLQEMVIETNRRRFGRDGTMYPAQRYSRSTLRYAATEADRLDTLPEWYSDKKSRTIVVRIPWGKLYVTDPSSHRVFKGFTGAARPELQASFSAGVDVSVMELDGAQMSNAKMTGSFPAVRDGHLEGPARVTWKNWETVELVPYEKKAFGAMEKVFLEQNGGQQVQTDRSKRAAGSDVRGASAGTNAANASR
jgi:tetratricopeptide (TPR) repeat protein